MAGNQPNTDAHSTACNQGSVSSPGDDGKVVSAAERSSNAQTNLQRYLKDDGDRPVGDEKSRIDIGAPIAKVDALFSRAGAGQAHEKPRQASAHEEETVRAIGDQLSTVTQERPKRL
ncbi:hypothetical protein CGCS363_v007002 [Colletotrichum siamense]|uniref:uncharacterized protein n=1 Tax=Colletotrichum siamense TaxID=690259 RepID=UPI0018730784|nr:uncharacterized protein CGCS363_v007002 [Colletotrichum siamense]KAF5500700.1 hypothetical protein CGCS363_v007002 [Colletotrichum siamense]